MTSPDLVETFVAGRRPAVEAALGRALELAGVPLSATLTPLMAPANIALAGAAASILAWRVQAVRRGEAAAAPFRRGSPVAGPLLAFVLLGVLSALFSTLPSRSLVELKGLTTFFFLPAVLALVRDGEDADLFLDGFRLTVLWLAGRSLVEIVAEGLNLYERITGGTSSYMTFAGLLVALSVLLLGRAFDLSRPRLTRAFDAGCGLVAASLVGLSLTRGAYVGLAAGLLVLLLLVRPRWALVVVPVLAILLLGPAPVRKRALSAFDPSDPSTRDRVLMWKAGASMVADRPLFGLGPKRVKDLYPLYRRPGFVDPRAGHLHNNVVMLAAETGIPSALAYLALLASFFAGAWPIARGGGPAGVLAAGCVGAVAALTVAGLTEYNFGDVEVLRLLLVLLALPFAARGGDPP